MGKPRKVDVGPYRYTVAWMPDLPSESGFLNTDQRLLVVAESTATQTQQETLLHEILHAVIDCTNLRGAEKDEEEKLVAALSPVLLQVLRSNPKVLGFLVDRA